MIELLCLTCQHIWDDPEFSICPECDGMDILIDDETESSHFEGDFGGLGYALDISDED